MLSESKRAAILELQKRAPDLPALLPQCPHGELPARPCPGGGHRIRQIARTLGASPTTVRSIIESGTAQVPRPNKAEPCRESWCGVPRVIPYDNLRRPVLGPQGEVKNALKIR
jgi:hypothetical protein